MMKVLLILLLACVCLSESAVLNDKFNGFREKMLNSSKALGGKLKEVTEALGDVAKDKAKSLGSQALQAIFGAFVESFKGFDLGKMIFGKRDMLDTSEIHSFIHSLEEEMHLLLEGIFQKTYSRFSKIVQNLGLAKSAEELHKELNSITDEHKIAVRGVVGDTLNTAIDGLRKLYYKAKGLWTGAKDMVFGSKKEAPADPIMIGRRGMLSDAWDQVKAKLHSIKEKYMPKVERVSEMTGSMAAALKHHTGIMFEQAKQQAAVKVQETLGYLSDELHRQLKNARNTYESVKQNVAQSIESFYQ